MRELFTVFNQALIRDLQIYASRKSEWLSSLVFFVIVVSLFPLALGPLPKELLWIVPGIIWIAALLATLLSQESLLRADFQLGIFEQCIVSSQSLSVNVLAKVLANWLVTGLPLVLITPLLALTYALPVNSIVILTCSLLLGTPALCLIGTLGAALTLSLPRGGLLLAILILPLYIPVLVLGTAAGILSLQGISSAGQLALLTAVTVGAVVLAPLAISTTIRVSVS